MTALSRTVPAAAVLLVAAGLSGCSSPAPQRLPGVTIRVLQYRSDIAPHQVQLEVVNGSDAPITVAAAELRGSGYSPALRWTDDEPAEIAAGRTVDLPARLSTASCSSGTALSGRLRLTDGTTRTVRAVDSHSTLATLRRQDCFSETAAKTATVTFAGFRETGGTAELDVAVRAGEDARGGLTIQHVLPTTLLSPADGGTSWQVGRRLTGDGTVTLRAVPTRCDLHAIAEDKVGTVLPVQVELADGASGTVDAVAPAALKNRILAWVVRACGTG